MHKKNKFLYIFVFLSLVRSSNETLFQRALEDDSHCRSHLKAKHFNILGNQYKSIWNSLSNLNETSIDMKCCRFFTFYFIFTRNERRLNETKTEKHVNIICENLFV